MENPERQELIKEVVTNGEAIVTKNGALAIWNSVESTGRSPKDTFLVRRSGSEKNIDWDSPNNIPISPDTFDLLVQDATNTLNKKEKIYVTHRVLGADSNYALPVTTISSSALTALFTNNMFRAIPDDIKSSVFYKKPFTILVLPHDKLNSERYKGRLRSNMAIAIDLDRMMGVVYGSAYCGSVKKLMFSTMNYILPTVGVLPLHAAANEGPSGDSALFLGLSGTGKTSLSADSERRLLGDDEHAWSHDGIFNLENGCYAKMIDLDPIREPELYNAVMHKDHHQCHGAIVENAMVYPNGIFDFSDNRFTENSRGSFPLGFLHNIKPSSCSNHPKNIFFLTADANGVISPISRLTPEQAMLWFLMGYTSKLSGTETGIIEPISTFSRFFGEPFMPWNPSVYINLFGKYLKVNGTKVWLVNTGWSGGPFGIGKRMDIRLTKHILKTVLEGKLNAVDFNEDSIFHYSVPNWCPGLENQDVLLPKNTWKDKDAYDIRARRLAQQFNDHFEKMYGDKGIDLVVANQCPGEKQLITL